MINTITIAIPYYEAPEMLKVHLKYWAEYPQELRDKVQVVIVDDGSQKYPAESVLKAHKHDIDIKLYKIIPNIPWNQGGARNLAMCEGLSDEWVVCLDMDLVLPCESVETLFRMDLDKNIVYRPTRMNRDESGNWVKWNRHLGTFIITRRLFWRIGGFDEDFAGYYNGSFSPFRRQMRRVAKIDILPDVHILNYCFEVKDASVTEWGRGGTKYDIRNNIKDRRKQRHAESKYNPVNPLRFEWNHII